MRERQGQREVSHLLIHMPNAPNSQSWARLRSGASNVMVVLHVNDRAITWIILCWRPECIKGAESEAKYLSSNQLSDIRCLIARLKPRHRITGPANLVLHNWSRDSDVLSWEDFPSFQDGLVSCFQSFSLPLPLFDSLLSPL